MKKKDAINKFKESYNVPIDIDEQYKKVASQMTFAKPKTNNNTIENNKKTFSRRFVYITMPIAIVLAFLISTLSTYAIMKNKNDGNNYPNYVIEAQEELQKECDEFSFEPLISYNYQGLSTIFVLFYVGIKNGKNIYFFQCYTSSTKPLDVDITFAKEDAAPITIENVTSTTFVNINETYPEFSLYDYAYTIYVNNNLYASGKLIK